MDLGPTRLQLLDRLKPVENAWKPRKETKVVLITLPSPWLISDRDMPNLGVLYVAAYLREQGVNVQVVDFCGVPQDYWFIPEADVYGISCTTPQYPLAKHVAAKLRSRQPDAYLVMGGYHPTALPEFTLQDSEVDCVVAGDGEYSMLRVLRDRPDGIVPGERVDQLDTLPWPARDMIDIRAYQKIGTNAVVGKGALKEEYVLQSRGCPFTCGYCAQMLLSNRRVRYRSPECIRDEMVYLLDRYRVNRFYIFDDIFIVDKKRVHAFCDMVDDLYTQGYSFDWHCLARADVGSRELYQRMADSHCKQITYGLEHADNRILKHNLKECTAEQNMEAVVAAKAAGLRVRAQFIVGLPGETDESVAALADFIQRCPADSMAAHIFVPLPGSPIYTHPERFGFDWNRGTDFLHYQTIGKPGEWKAHMIHKNPDDILRWANRLKAVIADKNVFKHDARHQAVIQEGVGAC